jgi:hypothetical protein
MLKQKASNKKNSIQIKSFKLLEKVFSIEDNNVNGIEIYKTLNVDIRNNKVRLESHMEVSSVTFDTLFHPTKVSMTFCDF